MEIFFYDEKKGGRGFTTGYKMPKQIAENALGVVSTRYTTEAQEMQLMEQQMMDTGSLSDISSNQVRGEPFTIDHISYITDFFQAVPTSQLQLNAVEEETEAKVMIQNQLLHLEEMKSTLQAMTDRLAKLQETL